MANTRKMKVSGTIISIILLLLISAAAHFMVLPFFFNQVERKDIQVFNELENNILDIDRLINVKRNNSISNQDHLVKIAEGESLLSKRTELLNKLESQIHSKWWKLLLPTKYQEYENKKVEAIGFLKKSDLELLQIKNIEYSIQRLIVNFDSYDKRVSYNEADTDWEVYINEAAEATKEGELIAKQSAEYLMQGILTKDVDDYIQQTVSIKNKFFTSFYDPQYLKDKNYIIDMAEESYEKLKVRPDIVNAMAKWNEVIVIPLSKIKGDDYTSYLDIKSVADKYYADNNLKSDPISKLMGKIGSSKQSDNSPEQVNKIEDFRLDLNGDGKNETLRLFNTDPNDDSLKSLSLIALDKDGKEMGRLPESMLINSPHSGSSKTFVPFPDQKMQIMSFDFTVGPHSSETIFFVYVDEGKVVLPICLKEGAQEREDCSFWSGELGELIVTDLDKDGLLEVVETVDEYPKDGKISEEASTAIDDAFKDLGPSLAAAAKRVAIREAGGRGNKVAWSIYKLKNNYFEQQMGTNYDKYFSLVGSYLKNRYSDSPTLIKRSDMSKESEDYNIFMRNFWTRRG